MSIICYSITQVLPVANKKLPVRNVDACAFQPLEEYVPKTQGRGQYSVDSILIMDAGHKKHADLQRQANRRAFIPIPNPVDRMWNPCQDDAASVRTLLCQNSDCCNGENKTGDLGTGKFLLKQEHIHDRD